MLVSKNKRQYFPHSPSRANEENFDKWLLTRDTRAIWVTGSDLPSCNTVTARTMHMRNNLKKWWNRMCTHLKSGSKNCYKAVFDFHLCPQEWTTLMHSETNLLQRSALWCYVGGRADVYSEDFLQTAPSAAIDQQKPSTRNPTTAIFQPTRPMLSSDLSTPTNKINSSN